MTSSTTASAALRIYQVRPIEGDLPIWLSSFLTPVLAAIKAEPFPIEFRPLGRWGGMSAGSVDSNPDRRIQISTQMLYVSKPSIARLYVHELVHNMLDHLEDGIHHNHNAAFCCMNLLLLMRLDDAGIDTGNASIHANSISFYDHQNAAIFWLDLNTPEHVWRPRETEWVLKTASKLRNSELSAIDLAKIVHDEYFEFVDGLMAEPEQKAKQKKIADDRRAQQLEKIARLKSDLFWARAAFFSMLAAFSAVVYSSWPT